MAPHLETGANAAAMRRRRAGRGGIVIAIAAVLLLSACGPPITVRRVPAREVTADLARSALNSNRPSLFSENALYRWGLTALYRSHPEAALAALRERLDDRAPNSTLFALAELCFQHAERTQQRPYYLAAVVYAYAFLFPDDAADRPEKLDPRARIAADLYNRGLTQAFASADRATVELRAGLYPLPFGQQLTVRLDERGLTWANRRLADFVPVAELEVRGLGARFRRPGIGAPLAASMNPIDPAVATADFVAPGMRAPVTALLHIEDPRRQLRQSAIDASMQIYNHYDVERVAIGGVLVPLESEPSATLAYSLSRSPVWQLQARAFLGGDLVGRRVDTPIAFIEPYRPGRIPVVFVHGTASNPGRWADMLNVLSNTRRLRDRFQYWFFFYDSSNAIPFSGMRLRQTLSKVVERLDPSGSDPALREMVVVGHSQGGLLTRLTGMTSGDRFWEIISARPIDELVVSDATRDLLRQAFFFEPLPFVRRLIFIATPHRGTRAAEHPLVNLIARFVRLPETVAGATADLVAGNPDALRFDPRRPALGSLYGMRPGSPFLAALADTPLDPRVAAHSIIPVRGDPPPDGQNDGFVSYESAHLEGVESELIIPRSGHSVQSNPLAIEEVRRILLEHADAVCRTSHVACGAAPVTPIAAPGPAAR